VKIRIPKKVDSLSLGFIGVILLLSATVFYASSQIKAIGAQIEHLYRHPYTVSNAAREIKTQILSIQQLTKDAVLLKNKKEKNDALKEITWHEQKAMENFDIISKRFLGDDIKVENPYQKFIQWAVIRQQAIDLSNNGEITPAADLISSKSANHIEALNAEIDFLVEFAEGKAITFQGRTADIIENSNQFTIVLSILVFFLSSFIATAVVRRNRLAGQRIIHEVDKVRAALLEAENLFDSSPEALLKVNSKGIIEKSNHSALILFEYSYVEIVGVSANRIIDRPHAGDHDKNIRAYFNDPTNREMLSVSRGLFALTKSGRKIPVSVQLSGLETSFGHYTVASVKDMSDRTEFEDDLKLEKELAEKSLREKSLFLAKMSHEIRTPLHGILGMADILAEEELRTESRKHLETLINSGQSLLVIANDILDLSKPESTNAPLDSRRNSFYKLLNEINGTYKLAMKDKGEVDMVVEIDQRIPEYLSFDAPRLQQILYNLINNAFKFTDAGLITLKAALIKRTEDLAEIEITVTDTGCGIPQTEQIRIFELFEQADNSTSRKYGGAGLGLAICKEIANRFSAKFWVESNVGQGSCFHLHLALLIEDRRLEDRRLEDRRHENMPIMNYITDDIDFSPISALIVDDNQVNITIAEALVKGLGISNYLLASDGKQALDIYINSQQSIDIILMDCEMPIMDGYTATREIRAYERENGLPAVKIFALTANVLAEHNKECFKAGMDGCLTKPVNKETLYQTIRAALNVI